MVAVSMLHVTMLYSSLLSVGDKSIGNVCVHKNT